MSSESRITAELRRAAREGDDSIDPDVLGTVVRRAARVRRTHRAMLATGVAATVLVAGGALVGQDGGAAPAPAPIASTSPSASSSVFRSSVYGYSVALPVGWRASPATSRWANGGVDFRARGTTVSDVLTPSSSASAASAGTQPPVTVHIAAQQIPAGMTALQWQRQFIGLRSNAQMKHCYPDPSAWSPVRIGGQPGGLIGGQEWCGFTAGIVVVGRTAVVIEGDLGTLSVEVFDMAVLNALFQSIDLSHAS